MKEDALPKEVSHAEQRPLRLQSWRLGGRSLSLVRKAATAGTVNFDQTDSWPFDQPRDCATFTTRQVLDGLEPILLVSHDGEDHGWQFIGTSDVSMADAKLVSLEHIVRLDPTVLEISDLPPGWQATRESVGGPWTRYERPPMPDDER